MSDFGEVRSIFVTVSADNTHMKQIFFEILILYICIINKNI
jgi:hypothetical protein